uniref:Amidase domain-containing protein n=1 Tax=Bionectria ochroleuca TaxID=29856 RepID=A0A0B7KBT1_BIOOC
MATEESLGMKTTSGAYALRNATARRDAFIVKKAREAGLVVIGKANLGELNGFKTPLRVIRWTSRRRCSRLCTFALGTETQGSISCPASFTALYGLKVSTGLLSRNGILPSSTTFDSPGILAKSAWDVAALLNEIVGVDPDDAVTSDSEPFLRNFTATLDANWRDFRIGVADREWFWSILPGFVGEQADIDDEKNMFSLGLEAVAEMERRGAAIIPDAKIRSASLSLGHVQKLMGKIIRHEMGPGFIKHTTYLDGIQTNSLEELVEFNHKHPEFSYSKENAAQGYLESALNQHLTDEEYHAALLEAKKIAIDEGIIETLDKYNLDALVLPAWTEMSIFAAWAQVPTATVPLGKYRGGKPYGLGFVARRFNDEKLLQIMKLYEDTFPPRLVPERLRWRRWESILPRSYLGALAQ